MDAYAGFDFQGGGGTRWHRARAGCELPSGGAVRGGARLRLLGGQDTGRHRSQVCLIVRRREGIIEMRFADSLCRFGRSSAPRMQVVTLEGLWKCEQLSGQSETKQSSP